VNLSVISASAVRFFVRKKIARLEAEIAEKKLFSINLLLNHGDNGTESNTV
jgi:hypothetical protein